MEVLIGLALIAIGVAIGYAYFRNKYKSEHMLSDPDFIECGTDALGNAVSHKDHAVCYIDRKSNKIKSHFDIAE